METRIKNSSLISILTCYPKEFLLFLLSVMCIFLSLYNSIFGIVALVLHLYALFSYKPEKYIILLISLMPWAYIYKIDGVSTSLFSILVIISAIKFLVDIKRVDVYFILALFLFVLNVSFHFQINNSTLTMFIKLIFNFLILYGMCNLYNKKHLDAILVFFIFSVLISSAIALLYPDRYIFSNRIRMEGTFVEFKYERFKGLQNDPNYYNASLVLCLLFLYYLYIHKKIGMSFFAFSSLSIYFGIITYSKSFFLLLLIWLVFIIIFSIVNKRYFFSIVMILICFFGATLIVSGRIQLINILLNRFNDAAGVTTGRTDIWEMFFDLFRTRMDILLWGNGFSTIIYQTHASHNTYIDLIYYFGLFGSIMFFGIIKTCINQGTSHKLSIYSAVCLFFVCVMYFFLSGITMCELPFVILFIYMFSNFENLQENGAFETNTRVAKYIKVKYIGDK